MIRYTYNQQLSPPAPFVHVTIRPPERGFAVSDLPALLDTAADITVIPTRVAEQLHLVPLDETPIGGFDGRVSWVSTFLVQLELRQSTPRVIRGVASRDEPYVLLGRDVLNDHRVVLDGPGLRLEIE
jgi:predicted aspartyl protease